MAKCRFCESADATVKANVIPKSFFVRHGTDSRLMSTAEGTHPKRSRIGPYDPNILCDVCEVKFGPFDEYGYNFFHREDEPEEIYPGTAAAAFLIRDFDFRLLSLFVASVIWRASVSNLDFYAGVRLGPHEEKLRSFLIAGEPVPSDRYPILLRRFRYPPDLVPILCPVRVRIRDHNFYQLLLNGYLILMKVDSLSLTPLLRDSAIADGRPIILIEKEYHGSPEHRIMVAAANGRKI